MSAPTRSFVLLFLTVALLGAERAAPPDWYTPLMKAAYEGHTEEVLRLIKDKANVNEPALRSSDHVTFYNSGMTPIIAAARGDQIEIVRILLEHGADVNAIATNEFVEATALIIAAGHGHTAMVKLLLAHKADVNAKTVTGYTALMVASHSGHLETVKLLVEHGADVNAMHSIMHDTALGLANMQGHRDIAMFLKQHGATTTKRAGYGGLNDVISMALLAGLAIGLGIFALPWALLNAAVLMWRARKMKGWAMPYRDAGFVAFRASFAGLGVGCLASIPVIYAEEGLTLLLGVAIPAFLASWWYFHSRYLLKLAGAPTPLALKDTGMISASVLAYQIPAALALWFLIDSSLSLLFSLYYR